MREDDEMFKQRKRLTQEIHSSIIKTLTDVNYKVPRSPGITRIYEYKNDEKKYEDLKGILKRFNGDLSFNEFLTQRVLELNDTDPNAWIVIESEPTDGTKYLQPYPFEVSSEEAINFEYNNNTLQWLLVKNEIEEDDETEEHDELYKYTIYGKQGFVKFTQIPKDTFNLTLVEKGVVFERDGARYIQIKEDLFEISEGTYRTNDKVPAFIVGFNRDKATGGKTYIPSWGAAIPYLFKTIKTVSELDITTALHAFPQKLQYAPMCEKCHGLKTIKGYDKDNHEIDIKCATCNGTGKEISTSAQDAITLGLPKNANADELIDLTRLVVYVNSVPTDLIRWQNEYIDSVIIKCKEVVFNSAVWNKEDVNKTATGVQANAENVYDSLFNLAQKYVTTWRFGIWVIAYMTSLEKDLEVITNVSKDLKLKTKTDYLNDLQLATNAGASASILRNIEHEIVRVDFEDNPLMFNMFLTKDFFFPFSGKDDAEVKTIISILPMTDFSKVLWMYFGSIFNDIELEYGMREFYMEMDRKKQKVIIDEKVQQKIAELDVLMTPKISIQDTTQNQ